MTNQANGSREAFESACGKMPHSVNMAKDADGHYKAPSTYMMLLAWNAAIDSAPSPDAIGSREALIDAMCMTWRHDFGIVVDSPQWVIAPHIDSSGIRASGMTKFERDGLRMLMRQLLDHHGADIAAIHHPAPLHAPVAAPAACEAAFERWNKRQPMDYRTSLGRAVAHSGYVDAWHEAAKYCAAPPDAIAAARAEAYRECANMIVGERSVLDAYHKIKARIEGGE